MYKDRGSACLSYMTGNVLTSSHLFSHSVQAGNCVVLRKAQPADAMETMVAARANCKRLLYSALLPFKSTRALGTPFFFTRPLSDVITSTAWNMSENDAAPIILIEHVPFVRVCVRAFGRVVSRPATTFVSGLDPFACSPPVETFGGVSSARPRRRGLGCAGGRILYSGSE